MHNYQRQYNMTSGKNYGQQKQIFFAQRLRHDNHGGHIIAGQIEQ